MFTRGGLQCDGTCSSDLQEVLWGPWGYLNAFESRQSPNRAKFGFENEIIDWIGPRVSSMCFFFLFVVVIWGGPLCNWLLEYVVVCVRVWRRMVQITVGAFVFLSFWIGTCVGLPWCWIVVLAITTPTSGSLLKLFLLSVFSFHWEAFNIHIRLTPTQTHTLTLTYALPHHCF